MKSSFILYEHATRLVLINPTNQNKDSIFILFVTKKLITMSLRTLTKLLKILHRKRWRVRYRYHVSCLSHLAHASTQTPWSIEVVASSATEKENFFLLLATLGQHQPRQLNIDWCHHECYLLYTIRIIRCHHRCIVTVHLACIVNLAHRHRLWPLMQKIVYFLHPCCDRLVCPRLPR